MRIALGAQPSSLERHLALFHQLDHQVHYATEFASANLRYFLKRASIPEELQRILGRSSLWATEEVLLASLAALAGHDVVANPFTHPALRYRTEFSAAEIEEALRDPGCWWVHPVVRSYDDPIRRRVRGAFQGYRPLPGTAATVRCTGTTPSTSMPIPPLHRARCGSGSTTEV